MSTKAAVAIGLPPGLNFHPDDDELVEFFLLPTVRGEPAWLPGVILLERHGLAGDDEAYFFVRTKQDATKEAARQDRYCAGGARWVSQRPVFGASCIGGERIEWRRINLNLQMGRGRSGGGSSSTGWVMHEYTLTEPACPSLKICHVSFSGHGKDRKRVPDEEYSDCRQTAGPASKRARVDADANSGSSTCVYGPTAPAIDQGQGYGASGDVFLPQLHAGQQEHSLPLQIDQGISATAHQQHPLPEDENATNISSLTCCYEPMQATDEQILDWGSSLAEDTEPTAEQQEHSPSSFPIDQGILDGSSAAAPGGRQQCSRQQFSDLWL
ncbi:NAC domain-containing protein 41-like [Panicum virgatum]|uniref:NAC domain-containing protein 41-like n=1 Tax=Panicum virgatum TaxID=38727 RepID=UPI0019D5CEE6|nr:NAC domain-containing protein 41-like [Panicum virgatum]